MDALLVYDVNISAAEGRARLRRVAKTCEGYGTRVQQSVFELVLNGEDLPRLQRDLDRAIDRTVDSIRIYRLGAPEPIRTMGTTRPLHTTRGPLVI